MFRAGALLLFLLLLATGSAQTDGTIFGTVRTPDGRVAPFVNVLVDGMARGTQTNDEGRYELSLPSGSELLLKFSFAGSIQERRLTPVAGQRMRMDVELPVNTLGQVDIRSGNSERDGGLTVLDAKLTRFIPTPLNGVEALLSGQLGVVMRNELSSGYSVRGGNFDENLVYVNDIEVYRPFLVRSGQQEGLSFPNPDMIERIHFSAGGFEARYGDKLSSVLDITYRRPKEFGGSATMSLLGGAVHLESAMLKKRLRQITGFRYRTNSYLLKSLDTQGEYKPRYVDLQSYWTFDVSDKVELGFLGLYSSNKYDLIPQSRETELGNFNQALRFTVYFEGEERTAFDTYFGALNLNWKANKETLLKLTASAYRTFESEHFDILGQYYLDELDRDLGSDQFGEVVRNLGVGTFLDHARNDLDATVITVAHKGFRQLRKSYLQWGVDGRRDMINDKLSEWTMIDSSDYSTPQSGTGDDLELNYVLKSKLSVESYRFSGYLQNAWNWETRPERTWGLTVGARANHWTYNGETVISPRIRASYSPGWKHINNKGDTLDRQHRFWFATGLYYQPPFYRELRGFDGQLNPEIKAQRSLHFLLGWERGLRIFQRPFKLTGEAYYKYMDNVIPYEVDNVRIRYYGRNNAKGYAAGLDLKLNGELIKGIESWAGVSVMTVQEDLTDDYYYLRFNAAGDTIIPGYTFDQVAVDSTRKEPGYIAKPTDQRVNFALFFQDEMPRWPTFKVHLNLVFGTGLPFGPPNDDRYSDTLRTKLYRRVDIGFSKQFLGAKGQEKTGFLRHINDLWLTVEVFNLLNINNTIDYTWVQDVGGRFYAIPDNLTPRRLNVKLIAWF
ncbi:MAG: TonB-dependent receptor [Flavobacteriales bacterium]|nr:TonB-dependent receptor [Flavobacteriales bacterium]